VHERLGMLGEVGHRQGEVVMVVVAECSSRHRPTMTYLLISSGATTTARRWSTDL
jgi:hypothetical protein